MWKSNHTTCIFYGTLGSPRGFGTCVYLYPRPWCTTTSSALLSRWSDKIYNCLAPPSIQRNNIQHLSLRSNFVNFNPVTIWMYNIKQVHSYFLSFFVYFKYWPLNWRYFLNSETSKYWFHYYFLDKKIFIFS